MVRGGGWWGGGGLHKVGGVLVDVGRQEVLHGCCVEHDGDGASDVGTLMEGVDCGLGEREVGELDTWCEELLLLDARALIQN